MTSVNELELTLRRLPGVRSAGFTEHDDMLFVQVHTESVVESSGLALQVTRLASRYTDRKVAVELVRWQKALPGGASTSTNGAATQESEGPPEHGTVDLATAEQDDTQASARDARVRLLAVLSFPDTDEIEVHLTLHGQRTIGRAVGGRGLIAAVDATVDALGPFLSGFVFTPSWAQAVENTDDAGHVVAVGLTDGRAPRHGIAAGETDMEAAARATLDALNRTLSLELTVIP
jgi:hypothetical protein